VAKSGMEIEEKEREKLKLLRFYTWPKDKEKVMEVGSYVFFRIDFQSFRAFRRFRSFLLRQAIRSILQVF
jgi:hypothetical protein